MGFFSGISKIAGGLSGMMGGPEQSQGVPASGFYSMPQQYQDFYTNLAGAGNSTLLPGGKPNSGMFTPMSITAGEQSGIDRLYQGFTPTAETLGADINMLTNPYDEYVINGMNREATGANSLVNQAATRAGQQGSNRSFLGTSDVEQNRLNSIGQFKQGQYNTTIDNILSKLVPQRQADAYNALGAGSYMRDIDSQTKQAPFTALSAAGGLLGGMPTQFGTQSQAGTAESGSSAGSTFGKIAQGAQLAGTIASLFSDIRLKEEIEYIGEENGIPIYHFNYIGGSERYKGVMAQDVLDIKPEAVHLDPYGFYRVNYDMLGINMEVVDGV